MSNAVLTETQQPGAAFVVGGNPASTTGPTWSSLNNPQISQGLTEFYINQGYKQLMGDIKDIQLSPVSFTLNSAVNTAVYPIPPSSYAAVAQVSRVWYQPFGLPYNREFRPGTEFVSWDIFQEITGQGYLLPYAFGTQPLYVTVDPTRKNLYFYPGSARVGDTITVEYAPLPTYGATGCPTLVAATDSPITPDDTHWAILYFAFSRVWLRLREMELSQNYYRPKNPRNPSDPGGLYQQEIDRIKADYMKLTAGDSIRITPFVDKLSLGAPVL